MKSFLIVLTLLPTFCIAQNLSQDGIWKAGIVQDTSGNEIRYRRQDFIKIKGDSVFHFQFQELESMETGRVKIETKIDTMPVSSTNQESIYELSFKGELLKLEMTSENELQIFYPKYILPFKKMREAEQSHSTLTEFHDFIIGSTFIKIDPTTKDKIGTLSKHYQYNGKVKYQTIGSSSSWESAFRIVEFEGYIFLKGITSPPVLLMNIEGNEMTGIEADYRFEPKIIGLKKAEQ